MTNAQKMAVELLDLTINRLESCDKQYLEATRSDLLNFLGAYSKAGIINRDLYTRYYDLSSTIYLYRAYLYGTNENNVRSGITRHATMPAVKEEIMEKVIIDFANDENEIKVKKNVKCLIYDNGHSTTIEIYPTSRRCACKGQMLSRAT